MLKISSVLFTILAVMSFFFATPVFAGGQMVDMAVDSNGWTSDAGFGRTIWVGLKPGFPCKGTGIKFRFVEPKEGDYIMTGSGNATYVMQEDRQVSYKNGVKGSTCQTYAKIISKEAGRRKITVDVINGSTVWQYPPVPTVDFDGKYYPDNHSSYGSGLDEYYSYNSHPADDSWYADQPGSITPIPTSTPYPVPQGQISVWVLNQQFFAPFGRTVTIKWSALQGPIFYKIYSRQLNEKDWQVQSEEEYGPSAVLKIRADQDYQVKVQGCLKKVGTCVDSDKLFLPKLQEQGQEVIMTPIATPIPTVSSDDTQLKQKVDDLQKQLEASQKRQASLEKTVNDLVKWIKSIFPFFGR